MNVRFVTKTEVLAGFRGDFSLGHGGIEVKSAGVEKEVTFEPFSGAVPVGAFDERLDGAVDALCCGVVSPPLWHGQKTMPNKARGISQTLVTATAVSL